MTIRYLVLALAALLAAGCQSSGPATCDVTGGLPLNAAAPWPKFRRDMANTGQVASAQVSNGVRTNNTLRWAFPAVSPVPTPPLGPIAISPIVGPGDQVYLLSQRMDGSSLLQTYVINGPTGLADPAASIFIPVNLGVNSTPTLMEQNHLIIALSDGSVREFNPQGGVARFTNLGGLISAAPALDSVGTVYIGADTGTFLGLCANSAGVFALQTGGTQSTAAVVSTAPNILEDERIFVAGNDGRIQMVNYLGQQLWSGQASARIDAAVVLDNQRQLVYVADSAGFVFAFRQLDGVRCPGFNFNANAPISASPALGTSALYVGTANGATNEGTLYALNLGAPTLTTDPCDAVNFGPPGPPGCQPGVCRWEFPANGPIRSSPAVATATGLADAIVFGTDVNLDVDPQAEAGTMYAIEDATTTAECLWTFDIDSPIGRSSAALGSDGTVYVGSEGGRIYAIGPALGPVTPVAICSPTPTPTPSP